MQMEKPARTARRKSDITEQAVSVGKIPHFMQFQPRKKQTLDYLIVIPSYNRPRRLCEETLALLRRHDVPLGKVHVFVNDARGSTEEPQWKQYHDAIVEFKCTSVQLHRGGRDLVQQMSKIFSWAAGRYVVLMSDAVNDILWKDISTTGSTKLTSLPRGGLQAVIQHGYALMMAGNCMAWSLGASHDGRFMKSMGITRRVGLLDGNFAGMIVNDFLQSMTMHPQDGLVYDVALACQLWSTGHRFFRYLGMCCKHTYRSAGGQSALFPDKTVRREAENQCIRRLERRFPDLIKFNDSPKFSLKRMQYKFLRAGPDPWVMRVNGRGRLPTVKITRLSNKERQAMWRQRNKAKSGDNASPVRGSQQQ